MGKNLFVLTAKDLLKLSAMMLLATIFFGLTGLVIMIILQWFTRQSYAQDSVDKHGISKIGASRLGGLAVILCTVGLIGVGTYTGLVGDLRVPFEAQPFGWLAVLACMALGLTEDLYNDYLSPRFRLWVELIIFALLISYRPELIPLDLGVWGLDALMAAPVMGWLLTVIFCVGFINAVNMADGANGLMPGILAISFSLFFAETGSLVYAALMISCGLFAIFNVISGRIFLGDAGSYGLGAALVLSGLFLFSEGVFSAPFLAVLLAYPCIDFVSAIVRRRLAGRAIFLPDNDHLHNRIHFHFQKRFRSATLANSLTGGVIVASSAGIAMLGNFLNWLPVTSQLWALVFILQCIAYVFIFYLTGLGRPISQHVVDV
jgi:UDP-N-acetylmuramyl pentapeptide phosphotransferase/UDP-N-acetylglucosamine-1-phosphate transferase